jgi:hypothetical protein
MSRNYPGRSYQDRPYNRPYDLNEEEYYYGRPNMGYDMHSHRHPHEEEQGFFERVGDRIRDTWNNITGRDHDYRDRYQQDRPAYGMRDYDSRREFGNQSTAYGPGRPYRHHYRDTGQQMQHDWRGGYGNADGYEYGRQYEDQQSQYDRPMRNRYPMNRDSNFNNRGIYREGERDNFRHYAQAYDPNRYSHSQYNRSRQPWQFGNNFDPYGYKMTRYHGY